MTDIVERLRGNAVGNSARVPWPHRLLHDAADEITRLRAALHGICMFNGLDEDGKTMQDIARAALAVAAKQEGEGL